jgi:hypothetical protein
MHIPAQYRGWAISFAVALSSFYIKDVTLFR